MYQRMIQIKKSLGIEWKKVYSITHPESLGKEGFFTDHEDAMNRNPDNETADLFSILGELEHFRNCVTVENKHLFSLHNRGINVFSKVL